MAKKKKKTVQKKLWIKGHAMKLLAWLDYTIQHPELSFDRTVEGYLERWCGKIYTAEQINVKLRYFWNDCGPGYGRPKRGEWKQIFSRGSSCLGLPDTQKEEIGLLLCNLEEEFEAKQLIPGHRRLRSASKPDSLQRSVPNSLKTSKQAQKRAAQYSLGRSRSDSMTPSGIKREIKCTEYISDIDKPQAKRRKKEEVFSRRSTTHPANKFQTCTEFSDNDNDNDNEPECASIGTIINDSEEEHEDTNEEVSERGESISASLPESSLTVLSSRQIDLDISVSLVQSRDDTRRSENTPEDSASSEIAHVKADRAISEIKNLQEQLWQKESELKRCNVEIEKLRNEVRLVKSVQSQLGTQSSEILILQKDKIIKDLRSELREREEIGVFAKIPQVSRHRFVDITENLLTIFDEAKQILCQHDSWKPFYIPSWDQYDELRLLMVKALGQDPDSGLQAGPISKLSLQAIIRALTASAVREWVFEANFPQVEERHSELLTKYREYLLRQDGPTTLRNLDLAAHRSMFKSEHFRERTIPDKASHLAVLLSQTLAPFFTKNARDRAEPNWDDFETWDDDEEEWRERRDRLMGMFQQSLTVKAESVLNIEEYEMVIFPPGTQFNKTHMSVETMDGMNVNTDELRLNNEGYAIQLCIRPAVYAYSKQELHDATSISEATVKSSNFVRKEKSQRVGVKPIIKALVILNTEPSPAMGRK